MLFGFNKKEHVEEQSCRDLTLLTTPTLNLVLHTPETLQDIASYGEILLSGKSLLLCLESMAAEDQQRAKDYLSGLCYPLGYTETSITTETMLYVPGEVEIIKD